MLAAARVGNGPTCLHVLPHNLLIAMSLSPRETRSRPPARLIFVHAQHVRRMALVAPDLDPVHVPPLGGRVKVCAPMHKRQQVTYVRSPPRHHTPSHMHYVDVQSSE